MLRSFLIAMLAVLAATPATAQTRQPPAQTPNYSTVPPVIPVRIYRVEQVVTPKLPAQLLAQIQPLKTLAQVEALLRANNIPYGWRKADMNTATLPVAVQAQIDRLPPGEVFVIPSGDNLIMSVIIGRR